MVENLKKASHHKALLCFHNWVTRSDDKVRQQSSLHDSFIFRNISLSKKCITSLYSNMSHLPSNFQTWILYFVDIYFKSSKHNLVFSLTNSDFQLQYRNNKRWVTFGKQRSRKLKKNKIKNNISLVVSYTMLIASKWE